MIDNAGHFLWDDEPEACSREVIAFLSSLPR
jgi:pimeloyl-ACP methyl ester carboxylesterase